MFKMNMLHRESVLSITLLLVVGCQGEPNRIEGFYLSNGDLLEWRKHEILVKDYPNVSQHDTGEYFLLKGHRLDRGNRLIISFRKYVKGKEHKIDSGVFEKLTVVVGSEFPLERGVVDLSKNDESIVFYSIGSSKFPNRGCFGYPKHGSINYSKDGDNLYVELDLRIETVDSLDKNKRCEDVLLNRSYVAHGIDYDDLTHWQGISAFHIYDESHP